MAAKASSKSKVPGWVWLFTGTVLGAFIMFLIRLSELQPVVDKRNPIAKTTQETEQRQAPRYDFYKLLKDTEVPVTAKKPEETPAKVEDNVDLYLQVASFRTVNDAEQVRAELVLLNLDAKVESGKGDGTATWHRVIVGPFATRSEMAKAQSTLFNNRFAPMMIKRKREG
jgi:cell division protein FtsN